MHSVILTGRAAREIEGVEVGKLTGPVRTDKPVIYTGIDPQTYEDVYRLYHYAIYPHYINGVPSVYAVPDVKGLFKRLSSISDPEPVSCPLTAEKVIRHLSRMARVKDLGSWKPTVSDIEVAIRTPLDPEQQEAAVHFLGPALVIAPAGSGKTSTIVTRIVLLVKRGILPERILCITFTRKAQEEMEARLIAALGREVATKITVKTYHALAYMLIGEFTGKKPEVLTDRLPVLNRLMEGKDYDITVEEADAFISLQMNNLVPPDRVEPAGEKGKQLAELYKQYTEYIKGNSITDHDNQLFELYMMLRDDPGKRAALMDYATPGMNPRYPKGRWHFVLVDEVQDNNLAQEVLTRFLVAPYDNLFLVGDEDQTLYEFRGSDAERILNIAEVYPNIREIYLKNNYRCHPEIVKAADAVIRNNEKRRQKEIKAAREDSGDAVKVFIFKNMLEEYGWVGKEITRLIEAGHDPGEIAVLYRVNAQGDAIAAVLKEIDMIPYYVHRKGESLFTSLEIECVLNHLAVLTDPGDAGSLLSCLRIPMRTDKIKHYEKALAGTPYPLDTLRTAAESAREWRVVEFCDDVRTSRLIVGALGDVGQMVRYVRMKFADIDRYFSGSDHSDRLDIIEGLAGKFKSVTDFFRWVQRIRMMPGNGPEPRGKVQLMTVHSAKGLEFNTVFLVNCTEGYFPYRKSCGTKKEIEGERRIFYVGMTRARDRLYMTGYQNQEKKMSRFLPESDILPSIN